MKDEPPLAGWPGLLCNAQYMMEKYQRQGETQRLPKESQRGKQTRERRKKKRGPTAHEFSPPLSGTRVPRSTWWRRPSLGVGTDGSFQMRTHSSCSSLALSLPLSLTLGPTVFPVKPVQPVPVPPFLVSLFSSAPTVDDTPRRHASPTPGPGPAHARHARPPPIFNLLLTRQTWREKKTPGK